MKAKNFLLRMNRGIALALVLIVGLSGFLIYDSRRFASEIPVIQEFLHSYVEAVGEINKFLSALPINERGELPSGARERIVEFANEFFVQAAPRGQGLFGGGWFMSRADVIRNLEELAGMWRFEGSAIDEAVFSVSNIRAIRKQGTNAVFVDFEVRSEVTGLGDVEYFNLFRRDTLWFGGSREFHITADGEVVFNEMERETVVSNMTMHVSALLVRSGGGWRFSEVSRFWSHGGRVQVTEHR